MRAIDIGRSVAGPAAASLMMALAVRLVDTQVPRSWGSGAELAVGVGCGALSYVVSLYLVAPRAYHGFLQLLREIRDRRAVDPPPPVEVRSGSSGATP
jgi:hypothetical protein